MAKPKSVNAYIAAASPAARPMLKQLRATIRVAAPQADEKISYGMPYYSYHGRLAYFAAFRDHVSLFVMGRSQRVYLTEQKKYKHGRATLQFPLGSRLPIALIKKLIQVRVKESQVQAGR